MNPENELIRHFQALCRLASHHEGDYPADCHELLRLCANSKSPEMLSLAAWTCVFLPETQNDLQQQALELIRRAIELRGADHQQTLWIQGALLVRMGQFHDGISLLERSIAFPNGDSRITAISQYFLTLGHLGLNHLEDARKCYDQAAASSALTITPIDQLTWKTDWQYRLTLGLLQTECANRLK